MHVSAIFCMAAEATFSGTLYAQGCSGGAGGGTDATGNECSSWVEYLASQPAPGTSMMLGVQPSLPKARTAAVSAKMSSTVRGTVKISKIVVAEAAGCSGGSSGGMDSTGNQCSDPDNGVVHISAAERR